MVAKFENNKRVAKNTLFLYARMLLLMLVSLYTSRIVLAQLGVVDYGLNNVVGGIITMFSFVQGAMSLSVQRYFSYEMGRNNKERLHAIFNLSFYVYILLAVVILVLGETVGLWVVRHKLVIPENRMFAALVVYQCSIVSAILSIIKVPYNAIILSGEKFNIYAYLSIIDALLSLFVAFMLCVITFDKWIFINVFGTSVAILMLFVYIIYVRKKYSFARLRWIWEKDLFKGLIGFSAWTMLGEVAWLLTSQGTNILLNIFFGPIVNAARAISTAVSNAANSFVRNFTQALNPQLIKLYASGEKKEMFSMLYRGTRFSSYLILFLATPLLLETHYVLFLWLGKVPEHAVLFCQLVLISLIIDTYSHLLETIAKAYGKIKKYQIVVSLVLSLNFPLTYLCFKWGCFPEFSVLIYIGVSLCLLFVRLNMTKKMVDLSPKEYFSESIFPVLKVSFLCLVILLSIHSMFNPSVWRFIFTCVVCTIITPTIIYFIGINDSERRFVKDIIEKKLKRKKVSK